MKDFLILVPPWGHDQPSKSGKPTCFFCMRVRPLRNMLIGFSEKAKEEFPELEKIRDFRVCRRCYRAETGILWPIIKNFLKNQRTLNDLAARN